jgi:predicted PurR-regulated permease PerM
MQSQPEARKTKISASIAVIILVSLSLGAIVGYYISYLPISIEIHNLESQLSTLNQRIDSLQTSSILPSIIGENHSLPLLFDQVRPSVVVVKGLIQNRDFFGRIYYTQVQGSGFICNFDG